MYANTCGSYLDKLIKLNNKLLRILQNKTLSTPVFELYLEYNTLPIPQLHVQQLLLFVHKFVHHPDTLPAVFVKNNYFIPNSQVHNYSTRIIKICIYLISLLILAPGIPNSKQLIFGMNYLSFSKTLRQYSRLKIIKKYI